ncbi:hypothetical protein AB0I81_30025 [Nonomuraea sp. NPDC050404]|uniref:hypothetical protein n=1 Tax=Nonomuraea sp. NPDC050404 TaxID=3155783 RepID=UPI0033C4DF0A
MRIPARMAGALLAAAAAMVTLAPAASAEIVTEAQCHAMGGRVESTQVGYPYGGRTAIFVIRKCVGTSYPRELTIPNN